MCISQQEVYARTPREALLKMRYDEGFERLASLKEKTVAKLPSTEHVGNRVRRFCLQQADHG